MEMKQNCSGSKTTSLARKWKLFFAKGQFQPKRTLQGSPIPPADLHPRFTFALWPTGLGSSHFVVRMVASLCIIWGTFPVCRISTSVDLPCRGGPMTIIFISLHFSARRSCARKYASTVLGPVQERAGWALQHQPPRDRTHPRAAGTPAELLLPLRINKETSSGQT